MLQEGSIATPAETTNHHHHHHQQEQEQQQQYNELELYDRPQQQQYGDYGQRPPHPQHIPQQDDYVQPVRSRYIWYWSVFGVFAFACFCVFLSGAVIMALNDECCDKCPDEDATWRRRMTHDAGDCEEDELEEECCSGRSWGGMMTVEYSCRDERDCNKYDFGTTFLVIGIFSGCCGSCILVPIIFCIISCTKPPICKSTQPVTSGVALNPNSDVATNDKYDTAVPSSSNKT
jgi:hypothetical protein